MFNIIKSNSKSNFRLEKSIWMWRLNFIISICLRSSGMRERWCCFIFYVKNDSLRVFSLRSFVFFVHPLLTVYRRHFINFIFSLFLQTIASPSRLAYSNSVCVAHSNYEFKIGSIVCGKRKLKFVSVDRRNITWCENDKRNRWERKNNARDSVYFIVILTTEEIWLNFYFIFMLKKKTFKLNSFPLFEFHPRVENDF